MARRILNIEKRGTGGEIALPQGGTEDDDFYLGRGTDGNQDSSPVRRWLAQSVPRHRPVEGLCRGSQGRPLAEWSV